VVYLGWLDYDGIEISNIARTEVYARDAGIGWLTDCDHCDTLAAALSPTDVPVAYTSPMLDPAPWFDPTEPKTADFLGFVVTDMVGLDRSTHQAQTEESINDGGAVHTARHGTREVLVQGLLVATSDNGLETGLDYLEWMLHNGDPCEATDMADDALLDDPLLWDEGGIGYAGPQPQPTAVTDPSSGPAMRLTFSTAPTVDADKTAFFGTREQGFVPGLRYRLQITVKTTNATDEIRLSVLQRAAGPWVKTTGGRMVLDFVWLAESDTPFIGVEVRRPSGGWGAVGTYTVTAVSWRQLKHPANPDPDSKVLSFFRSCPDRTTQFRYLRNVYDTHLTVGPAIVERQQMSTGWMARVEFTLTAESPYIYSAGVNLRSSLRAYRYDVLLASFNTYQEVLDSAPSYALLGEALAGAGAGLGPTRISVEQPDDPLDVLRQIESRAYPACAIDPDCPPIRQFPGAPQDMLLCRPPWTGAWQKQVYPVDTPVGPFWTPTVFVMSLTANNHNHRDVRVRVTPRGDTTPVVEFYITWLPAYSTMTLHTPRNRVYLTCDPDGPKKNKAPQLIDARHLLISDVNGAPFRFPVVYCQRRYDLSIETRAADPANDLTLELTMVRRDR